MAEGEKAGGLGRTILQLISSSRRPIGQGTLNLILRQQGHSVSTPTVGRRLQELEFEGLLRKVSVDGRIMTDRGREVLARWNGEARLHGYGEALFSKLKRGDRKNILDLLHARRVIEGETASLAAKNSSARAIRRMESILRRQGAIVKSRGVAIEEDIQFHHEIAVAAGNAVLLTLVPLLRSHLRYDVMITSMRAVVGGRLVVDHMAILDAVKAHDSMKARHAMWRHLTNLESDVDRYWKRRMRNR